MNDEKPTGRVLRFPPPRRPQCQQCGSHFKPLAAWHKFCSRCYRWRAIGRMTLAIAAQFRELRREVRP